MHKLKINSFRWIAQMTIMHKSTFRPFSVNERHEGTQALHSNSHGDHHGQASKHHNDNGHHHNGHSQDDHAHGHDDHGHHHEITGEVDKDLVYVPQSQEIHKFVGLVGLPSYDNKIHHTIEGDSKAYHAVTPIAIPLITRNRKRFKALAGVPNEENPYFHPEPYGYLVSDDPFSPNPNTSSRYLAVFMFIAGIYMIRAMFRSTRDNSKEVVVEKIFHAHYTANLIEDEIRRIRREDYPVRERYNKMKDAMLADNAVEEVEAAEDE